MASLRLCLYLRASDKNRADTVAQSWEKSPFSKVKSSVNSLSSESRFILNSFRCQELKCQVNSGVYCWYFFKLKSSFNSFTLKLMWSQLQMAHQKTIYRCGTWTWARTTLVTLYQSMIVHLVWDYLRRISNSVYSWLVTHARALELNILFMHWQLIMLCGYSYAVLFVHLVMSSQSVGSWRERKCRQRNRMYSAPSWWNRALSQNCKLQ